MEINTGTATGTGGSSSGYILTTKPPCYKSKCEDCAHKSTCANKDKDLPYFPYVPYVPTTPSDPYRPIIWCFRS